MIPPEYASLIVELVEKAGLLRRDMVQKKEFDKWEGRLARIEQKVSALAERLAPDDPALAKALRTAWEMPARSLAFRNAEHKKELDRAAAEKHIVLLGDSILDNRAYTSGDPDVVTHLGAILPPGWTATLLAVDGATTTDVARQAGGIPHSATHVVLSVGGNDALMNSDVLQAPVRASADALVLLADRLVAFEATYRAAVKALVAAGRRLTLCTIYEGAFAPEQTRVVRPALVLFNDVILRVAFEQRLDVIELRAICVDPDDYANPIEPSGRGGLKIAGAIARAVGALPAATASRVFVGP